MTRQERLRIFMPVLSISVLVYAVTFPFDMHLLKQHPGSYRVAIDRSHYSDFTAYYSLHLTLSPYTLRRSIWCNARVCLRLARLRALILDLRIPRSRSSCDT